MLDLLNPFTEGLEIPTPHNLGASENTEPFVEVQSDTTPQS